MRNFLGARGFGVVCGLLCLAFAPLGVRAQLPCAAPTVPVSAETQAVPNTQIGCFNTTTGLFFSSGGGGTTVATFSIVALGAKFNGHKAIDAATTNGNAIITSATAHFLSTAIVGEDVYVLNAGTSITGTGFCQIASIDSDTQVHATCNNSATLASNGILFYATNDDAAWSALDAAIAASHACEIQVLVPAGLSRVTQAHLSSAQFTLPSQCTSGFDSSLGGIYLLGGGIKQSAAINGPGYNYANTWGTATTNMYYRDFQFDGLGIQDPASDGKVYASIGNAGDASFFSVSQMNNTRTMQPISFNSNGAGCLKCFFDTVGPVGVNVSGSTDFQGTFIAKLAHAGGTVQSLLSSYGQTGGPAVDCSGANSIFLSTQDKFYNVTGGTLFSFDVDNAGCQAFFNQSDFTSVGASTVGVGFQAGGTVTLLGTKMFGGSSGAIFSTGATGTPTVFDNGANSYGCSGCTNPLQGFTVGNWTGPGNGNNISSACTGAVTPSTTITFWPYKSVTVCTDVSVGSLSVNKSGKLYALFVTVTSNGGGGGAGDGVVTIQQNGANTVLTCTLGTGTTCRDVAHAPVSIALGDLIAVKAVIAAGSTISGIKVYTVEGN